MCFIRKSKSKKSLEISSGELEALIYDVVKSTKINTLDRTYRLPPFDEVIKFVKEDLTDKGIYVEDFKDCDDFAIQLWGLWKERYRDKYTGFGLALVDTSKGGHAVNIFVDTNEEVWLLEPQNDRVFLLEEKTDWKPYCIIF